MEVNAQLHAPASLPPQKEKLASSGSDAEERGSFTVCILHHTPFRTMKTRMSWVEHVALMG